MITRYADGTVTFDADPPSVRRWGRRIGEIVVPVVAGVLLFLLVCWVYGG
jgi:hypothetical protein